MVFVNLLGKTIRIMSSGDPADVKTIHRLDPPMEGAVCRLAVITGSGLHRFLKAPLLGVSPSHVEGLPEPVDGKIYVVPREVAEHPSCKDRDDLCYPPMTIISSAGRQVANTFTHLVPNAGLLARLERSEP